MRFHLLTTPITKMATTSDKVVGGLLIGLSVAIFLYYTTWTMILPFLEPDNILNSFFLPPVYAITLPLAAGVVFIGAIGVFVAVVTIKENARKKAKQKSQ